MRSVLISLAALLTACSASPLHKRHLLVWIDISRSFDATPHLNTTLAPAVRELRAGDRLTVALINDGTYAGGPLASITLGVPQPGIDAVMTRLGLAPTANINADRSTAQRQVDSVLALVRQTVDTARRSMQTRILDALDVSQQLIDPADHSSTTILFITDGVEDSDESRAGDGERRVASGKELLAKVSAAGGALPDLQGVTIVMGGIEGGSAAQTRRLREHWLAIAHVLGACSARLLIAPHPRIDLDGASCRR